MRKKLKSRAGIIISVIGGIASGKSLLCKMLKKKGFLTFDTDKEVHNLFEHDTNIFKEVSQTFPKSIINHKINRESLSKIVFYDHSQLKKLESIIHPVIQERRKLFIEERLKKGGRSIVCEIPLMIESKSKIKSPEYGVVIFMKSEVNLQKKRAMKRKGMTNDKFDSIISRQFPSSKKEEIADYTLSNHGNILFLRKKLEELTGERFKENSFRHRNHRIKRQRWSQNYRNRLCRAYWKN